MEKVESSEIRTCSWMFSFGESIEFYVQTTSDIGINIVLTSLGRSHIPVGWVV